MTWRVGQWEKNYDKYNSAAVKKYWIKEEESKWDTLVSWITRRDDKGVTIDTFFFVRRRTELWPKWLIGQRPTGSRKDCTKLLHLAWTFPRVAVTRLAFYLGRGTPSCDWFNHWRRMNEPIDSHEKRTNKKAHHNYTNKQNTHTCTHVRKQDNMTWRGAHESWTRLPINSSSATLFSHHCMINTRPGDSGLVAFHQETWRLAARPLRPNKKGRKILK